MPGRKANQFLPQISVLSLSCSSACFGWPMIRGNSMTANYDFITTFIVSVLFIKLLQRGKEITNNPFTARMDNLACLPIHCTYCQLSIVTVEPVWILFSIEERAMAACYTISRHCVEPGICPLLQGILSSPATRFTLLLPSIFLMLTGKRTPE